MSSVEPEREYNVSTTEMKKIWEGMPSPLSLYSGSIRNLTTRFLLNEGAQIGI